MSETESNERPWDFKELLGIVSQGKSLTEAQAETAFDIIMSGDATPSQMGGFLMALRVRGETVAEITGAARIMRDKATKIKAPAGAIDVVGTGGDKSGTYNISTAAALVVAGAGVPVAKHGNRAASSKSGSADVLTELGIDLETDFANVERAVAEAGIGFMMAQRHHGAMRNVGPTRVELGTPTIFNILGPLSNPALVKRYLIGCFRPNFIDAMAETLGNLGAERAWVVHGADGLDELSTTGVNQVASLENGTVTRLEIGPDDVGLPTVGLDAIKGGTPEENAAALRAVLAGETGAYRDVVLFNAGAALMIAGEAATPGDGVALAAQSIDSGAAAKALEKMVAITGGGA